MEYVGIKPTNLPDLLKVLKQIAVKVPRFPSENRRLSWRATHIGQGLTVHIALFPLDRNHLP